MLFLYILSLSFDLLKRRSIEKQRSVAFCCNQTPLGPLSSCNFPKNNKAYNRVSHSNWKLKSGARQSNQSELKCGTSHSFLYLYIMLWTIWSLDKSAIIISTWIYVLTWKVLLICFKKASYFWNDFVCFSKYSPELAQKWNSNCSVE